MTNDKIEYELKGLYEHLHLDEDVYDYCSKIEKSLKERFEAIDQVAEYNQLKVIHAMQKNRVSERHFAGTTGYGYDDDGRDTLEKVYADIFHCSLTVKQGAYRPVSHNPYCKQYYTFDDIWDYIKCLVICFFELKSIQSVISYNSSEEKKYYNKCDFQ